MPETIRKLKRIQGRPTKYEVILAHEHHTSILLRYTRSKSIQGLVAVYRDCLADIDRLTGLTSAQRIGDRFVTNNGWIVRFSGRTQREAIINGERPFCADIESLDYDPAKI